MIVIRSALLGGIFLVTAVAIMVRPRGIGEGWVAIGGAAVALATGLIPAPAAARGLVATLDVLALFAGLLLLSGSMAAAGVFDLLLGGVARWSGGSPRRLLVLSSAACALVTATLSNDASVLLLAPAVLRLVRRLGLPPAPYLLAMAFVANSASLILPMGNPVNLLVLDHAHLPVAQYLIRVTPPALVGTGLLLSATAVVARRLPQGPLPMPGLAGPSDRALAGGLLAAVGLLAGLDAAAAVLGLPLGVPTLAVGLLAAAMVRTRRPGGVRALRDGAPWALLPLVAGLSVLGGGLATLPVLAHATTAIAGHGAGRGTALAVGATTAALAAALNNLPAALLVTAGLGAAHHLGALALPVIAGADLGPNLAPMGSLSTLLLFALARRQGVGAGWSGFWRQALWAGPLSLVPVLWLLTG